MAEMNEAPSTQAGLSTSAEAEPQNAVDPGRPKPRGLAAWIGKIVRPTAKAAEEVVSTVVDVGADVRNLFHKATGTVDPDFQLWYENLKGSERHGLEFGKWAEGAFGERPEGWAGTAEDFIQFGTGFLAATKALKAPALIKKASTGLRVAQGVARAEKAGFLADFGFMDELENNFFGIVDKSPQTTQNAITRALASDEDDPATWNRLRNGLQGFVVGRALDKTVGVVRSMWLWRKAKSLPLGSPERKALEGRIEAISKRSSFISRPAEAPVAAPAAAPAASPPAPATRPTREAPQVSTRPSEKAKAFTEDVNNRLRIGLTDEGDIIDTGLKNEVGEGGVVFQYRLRGGDTAHIELVESLERGKGTKAMQEAVAAADANGITLSLNASPFGDQAMSPDKLRDFYRRFGFEQVKEGESLMVRKPGDVDSGFREVAQAPKAQTVAQLDVVQGQDGVYRLTRNGREIVDGPEFRTAGEANAAAASVNDFITVPTEELAHTTRAIQRRISSGKDPADVAGLLDGTVFNFHWVQSPENARAWINAVAEASKGAHGTATQSLDETARIAQEMFGGQTPQEALQIASDVLGAVEDLPAKVMGMRAYQHATAKYVAELSEKIDAGAASGLDADKLRTSLGTLFQMNPAVKRVGTRVAQSLNAYKGKTDLPGVAYVDPSEAAKQVPITAEAAQAAPKSAGPKAPASAGIFANMSKTDLQNLARNIRLTGGDPVVVDHFIRNVLGVKPPKPESPAWGTFQAIRYNSLLSGTLTHAKNTFSNLGQFLMRNAELSAQGLTTGNKEMFHQGVDQLSSLWLDSLESLKMAMKSVSEGKAIVDLGANREGLDELMEALQSNPQIGPKGWLTKLFRTPQTFLMAEDEFFKQLNYRSSVRAQALRDARQLGLPASKWGNHVQQTLDGAFTPTGGGINTTALDLARENTFTRDLEGLAKKGSDFIGDSKFLSFFFPFRKTPVNVFLAAAERTPGLWRMSTTMRRELAGEFGPQRAAEASSKLEMGQNLWLLATGLAASGALTGGGPKDPAARRQLMSTGWQPYSLKVGDKYVSFQSLEPFSTLMGIAADATDAAQDLSKESRRKDFEELAGAFLLGTAANVYNKSFLRGLNDMSSLLSGQESAGERTIASLGSQLIPFGGFLSQTANQDDVMRDAATVRERVLSRIPYFSEGIEPVRTVLGKPLKKQSWAERAVWPFAISEEAGTKEQALVKDLIDGLGEDVRIPLPASSLYRGIIDLRDREAWKRTDGKNQSPYDRLMELYGTGVGNLPPVEDALRAVVSEDRQALKDIFGITGYKFGYWKSAKPIDGIDVTESDTRLGIVRGVLNKYREAAYEQVLKEYPALAKKEAEIKKEQKQRRLDQAENRLDAFSESARSALP